MSHFQLATPATGARRSTLMLESFALSKFFVSCKPAEMPFSFSALLQLEILAIS